MVFLISMLTEIHSGLAVRSTRTNNPAKAYSIAKSHLSRQELPVTITLWSYENEFDYYVATYVINSFEQLDENFNAMVSDITKRSENRAAVE